MVESRRSNRENPPWKNLEPLRGPIEKQFLRPLYLGESIVPFRLLEPIESVIPWDKKKSELLDSESAQRGGYRHLAKWLRQSELLWNQAGKKKMSLIARIDKFRALSAQAPSKPIRVVYSKAGVNSTAAIIRDKSAVLDHKLYWAGVSTETEANYLTAAFNSSAIRDHVASRQSRGQWGPRDFDKLLAGAIPEFDDSDPLHRELAAEGQRAEKVAAQVELAERNLLRQRAPPDP